MQSTEIWKPIPGYEGIYDASSLGAIRTRSAHPKGRHGPLHVMRPQMHRNGYQNIGLRKGGDRKVIGVHRLVAAAFHGVPAPGQEASHADGDKVNNRAENLRWASPSENELDKRGHGTQYSHFQGRSECSRGHEYTEESTYRNSGRRHCRPCQVIRSAARKAALL